MQLGTSYSLEAFGRREAGLVKFLGADRFDCRVGARLGLGASASVSVWRQLTSMRYLLPRQSQPCQVQSTQFAGETQAKGAELHSR
jgi:hypothetical protein